MAKVFPLADVLDFDVDPVVYRMAIGTVEVVCGMMLAIIPGIYALCPALFHCI